MFQTFTKVILLAIAVRHTSRRRHHFFQHVKHAYIERRRSCILQELVDSTYQILNVLFSRELELECAIMKSVKRPESTLLTVETDIMAFTVNGASQLEGSQTAGVVAVLE